MAKRTTVPVADMIPVIITAVNAGKPVEMTVTGNSMLPMLVNRVSAVRLVQPGYVKKGDIVLYQRTDGHYVLHRIACVHGNLYDIVGDNQYATDRDVHRADIIAKVAAYSRDGRHWKDNDKDKIYLALLPFLRNAKYFIYRVRCRIKEIR